jgi:Ca2+-binding EF-hand superfamily protein
LYVEIATVSAPLMSDLNEFVDRLSAGIFADTQADVDAEQALFTELTTEKIPACEAQFNKYSELVTEADALAEPGRSSTPENMSRASMITSDNPYAVHSKEEIIGKWGEVCGLIPQRKQQIESEAADQAKREELRKKFAQLAETSSSFYQGLHKRVDAVQDDTKTELEKQLETLAAIKAESEGHALAELESVAKEMEAAVILENEHSNLTIEMVRGQQQGLMIYISTSETDIGNQIYTRDKSNITDEQMEEFRSSFKHFDKDRSGTLDKLEFRACLLSLGIDIPQVPTPGNDAEFERILKKCDPDSNGSINFTEFVAFMAEERADADSKDDLLAQFTTLAGGAAFIMPNMLNELGPELKEYCIQNMAPYEGGPEGALDYQSFAAAAFGEGAEV